MTPEEVIEIARIAKRYGRKHLRLYSWCDPDDFSQYCAEQALRRPDISFELFNFNWRLIDFLRLNLGPNKNPSIKNEFVKGQREFSEVEGAHNYAFAMSQEAARTREKYLAHSKDIDKYFFRVSKLNRLIYMIHHKYDIRIVELADCCNVTQGRICQIINDVDGQIEKNMEDLRGIRRRKKKVI